MKEAKKTKSFSRGTGGGNSETRTRETWGNWCNAGASRWQVDGKAEYEQMKSADHDMDGDDNPDVDPEV